MPVTDRSGPMILEGLGRDKDTVDSRKTGPDAGLGALTTPKEVVLNFLDSLGMGEGPRAVRDSLSNIAQMPQGNATEQIRLIARIDPHQALDALVAHFGELASRDSLSDMSVMNSLHAAADVFSKFSDLGLHINDELLDNMADAVREMNIRLPQGIIGLPRAEELLNNLGLDPVAMKQEHLTAA